MTCPIRKRLSCIKHLRFDSEEKPLVQVRGYRAVKDKRLVESNGTPRGKMKRVFK
jgi:hypothetical protein